MKLPTIPPLKIPLNSSFKKDDPPSTPVSKSEKNSSQKDIGSDSDSSRHQRSGKTVFYGQGGRHSGEKQPVKMKTVSNMIPKSSNRRVNVNFSREELVSVKWEGLWYQAKVLHKVNQDNYKLKFDSGMEKIFNEKFIRPWKKTEVKPVEEKITEECKTPPRTNVMKKTKEVKSSSLPKNKPDSKSETLREPEAKPKIRTEEIPKPKVEEKPKPEMEAMPEPETKSKNEKSKKIEATPEKKPEAQLLEEKAQTSESIKSSDSKPQSKPKIEPEPTSKPIPPKTSSPRTITKSTPKPSRKSMVTPPRKSTTTPARNAALPDEKKLADQAAQNIQVGDVVLARWADCKNYPATVLQIKKDGDYVVRYYDGYTKSVSPRLIKQWAPKQIGNTSTPKPPPRQPALSSPVTPPKQSDHHKYKCRAPECNKSFRKESLLLQHHKHYHHQRYKFRDETSFSIKRRPSRESGSGSGTPKRRVSADYEALMKADSPLHPPVETLAPTPEPAVRSKGGKPPMNIYRKHHSNEGSFSMEEDFKPPTPVPVELIPGGKVVETAPVVAEPVLLSPKKQKQSNVENESAMVEEELKEEVVVNEDVIRCSCLDDNEVGIMIQCEGCLTWQHMSCAENDKTFKEVEKKTDAEKTQQEEKDTSPLSAGYYCYVCRNPEKSRNAHKVLNQNEFLLTGEIRNILNDKDPDIPQTTKQILLLAVNDLMTELSHVYDVLLGVKGKLRIAADINHPKLHMWKDPVKQMDDKTEKSDDKIEHRNNVISNENSHSEDDSNKTKLNSNTPTKNKKNGKENKIETNDDLNFQCRDNLLDHIIDVEKSLVDRLTQLDGYIDVLEPHLDMDDTENDVEIAKNLLQVERDLTATHQLLKLTH